MTLSHDPVREATRLRSLAKELEDMAAKYRDAAAVLSGDNSETAQLLAKLERPNVDIQPNQTLPKEETREDVNSGSIWLNRIINVMRKREGVWSASEVASKLAEVGQDTRTDGSSMERNVFMTTVRNNLARHEGKHFDRVEGGKWTLI